MHAAHDQKRRNTRRRLWRYKGAYWTLSIKAEGLIEQVRAVLCSNPVNYSLNAQDKDDVPWKVGRTHNGSVDKRTTCGHNFIMIVISIRDAKNRLTEIARQVENGETITVTRNGRPILDLVPHRPQKGLRWEGIDAFKEKYGLATIINDIRDDFDDPLPEDFLLHPISDGPPPAER